MKAVALAQGRKRFFEEGTDQGMPDVETASIASSQPQPPQAPSQPLPVVRRQVVITRGGANNGFGFMIQVRAPCRPPWARFPPPRPTMLGWVGVPGPSGNFPAVPCGPTQGGAASSEGPYLPVVVIKVYEGEAAHATGQIFENDVLVAVNDRLVHDLTHDAVVNLIKVRLGSLLLSVVKAVAAASRVFRSQSAGEAVTLTLESHVALNEAGNGQVGSPLPHPPPVFRRRAISRQARRAPLLLRPAAARLDAAVCGVGAGRPAGEARAQAARGLLEKVWPERELEGVRRRWAAERACQDGGLVTSSI